ncbi:hypothetical protein MKK75_03080 [Methylobacterium sp. J-030]|uniref:hypothetical protein n=1 Tax=Methylobacterium sp. J-030 TaxID=2836627 RepID=UPI001FBB95D8|nr:hypothetical protein [Methylobacterium sp. J-030]MCJ2067799.1 hypothetical protein [Methylobacterium sp. J-030]
MATRSPSFWLLIAVLLVTAIMVHPSLAALLTAPAQLGLLVALRWQARREGRAAEKALRVPLRRGFV